MHSAPLNIITGLVVLLYMTGTSIDAQSVPDSLLKKFQTSTNDSTKAITLLEIGESIEQTNPEKSIDYYRQALTIGQRIRNNRVILSSYIDLGVCSINLNKMDSALIFFEAAIPFAKALKDTVREARVMANMGNAYLHKKDRVTAIDHYLKAARIWETSSDKKYLAILYSNTSALLDEQKEHTRAAEYGNRAVQLAQETGDEYSEVVALVNLSTTYSYLGQHGKEYELLERALPLARKNKDLDQVATVYHNMGDYFSRKNDYSTALEKYLESYDYGNQMGNKYHLVEVNTALALTYHKLNREDKAREYILQAETLAEDVGVRTKMKEIYLTRAEIEQRSGNYKLASEYYSKTLVVSDSLFKTETSEKVAEIEARYQNEKKQQEIRELENDKKIQSLSIRQKSTLNYILIGSLVALLVLGILVYRNLRQRQHIKQQKINELEKDRQLVAVDAMLKGQEEERSRLAKDLHDGLGGLLSGVKFSLSNMKDNLIVTADNMVVFERSLDMIDTSIKELRRVAHNMMPEMLNKFGLNEALKEYCNNINASKLVSVKYQAHGMEKRLDQSTEIIVYRIVQELLNNILKHASASEAFVQLIRDENRVNVVVEDNGKGFEVSDPATGKGAGLLNVRSRVDYLKGRLDIHAVPGKGTLVTIEFNV